MANVFIGLFTVILLLISVFTVLLILMQRASSNSGMGSALGGGAAESAFGGETGNILSKGTIIGIVSFFVIALGLYLGQMATTYEEATGTQMYEETLMHSPEPAEETTNTDILSDVTPGQAAETDAASEEATDAAETEAGEDATQEAEAGESVQEPAMTLPEAEETPAGS